MFDMIYTLTFGDVITWLVVLGAIYTLFGYYLGRVGHIQSTTETVIDALIDTGYLKTKKNADGQIEILKHNEN